MIAHSPASVCVAYLNSQYPSLSHTFIEREIRELRRRGIDITTFSVRTPIQQAKLGTAHRKAAEDTTCLLDSIWRLLHRACLTALRSPWRVLAAFWHGQRIAPPGIVQRVRHLAYSVEAARLTWEMHRRGLRHVHVHMANNGAMVALLACRMDQSLSYSLSIHGSAEFFHVDTWCLSEKVENAMFVRCISNFCKAQVMTWSATKSWPRFHVVHCGIDPADKPHGRDVMPATSDLRLIAVGRLCEIKGYQVLLEACASLCDRGISWSLNLVGDGPLRPELERLARTLDIADHVEFSGAVEPEKVASHYADADVMVCSSFMEGVPVVLMEAMALRRPVVTTNVGGIPELVKDDCGILVPPGSPTGLAEALTRLARERSTHSALGEAGRRHIMASFTMRKTGEEMMNLFTSYQIVRATRSPRTSTDVAIDDSRQLGLGVPSSP